MNFHCVSSVCLPVDACSTVKCSNGHHCVKGKCQPTPFPLCPDYKKIVCANPRPQDITCPIYSGKSAPNVICGIKANGERVGYASECLAFQDRSVVSYYKKSCDRLLLPCKKWYSLHLLLLFFSSFSI